MEFLCEYTVDRKKEGMYRFAKAGIIALWVIIPVAIVIAGFAVASKGGIWGMGYGTIIVVPPLLFFLIKAFYPATAAYAEVAYEYTISSGEMSFAKIFGNRFRREWFTLRIADMEKCAPYNSELQSELDSQRFDRIYNAAASLNADRVYCAIFKNTKGEHCLVYFQVIKKSLKMIKTYYPATVMTNLEF